MPTVGHLAVGLAVARHGQGVDRRFAMPLLAVLSILPDLDLIARPLGAGYLEPLAHRGIFHSPAVAMVISLVGALIAWRAGLSPWRWGVLVLVAVGSHGLLDSLNEGDLGVPLLWPFSKHRFLAGWFPAAAVRTSSIGLRMIAFDLVLSVPLLIYAFWPRGRATPGRP